MDQGTEESLLQAPNFGQGLGLSFGRQFQQLLYELVEQFVQRVGQGVMKLLILDRGFVDGQNISRCKTDWGTDVLIPMKKKMDIWKDAWAEAGAGQRP